MAPKKAAGGPKAKAKGKAEAKGKAGPEEPAGPSPEEVIEKEGEEQWLKWQEAGDSGGVIKLKNFAECIRQVNEAKGNIWTDDEIGPKVCKPQWDLAREDKSKREMGKDEFMKWWKGFQPVIQAQAEASATQKAADAAAKAEKEKAAAAKIAEAEATWKSDGLWKLPLSMMQTAMNKAFEKDKIPLILDPGDENENRLTETFFVYSDAFIFECKKWIMDKAKGGKVEEILEDNRSQFFKRKAFKYGHTVVFRMANSACDIKGTFNDEKIFPALALLDTPQWKKVLGNDNADNFKGSIWEKWCPTDEDKTDCICGVNEKFRVVALSHFKEEDYEKFLGGMFPLETCQPMTFTKDE